MSLIQSTMTDCVMLDKTTESDGRGGFTTVWKDGAEFRASIAFDGSTQGRIAEAQGATASYSVLTIKSVNLQFHDVFRRVEDGKIFRVTSDSNDNKTPPTAGLELRQVNAEKYTLPTGI